MDSVTLPLGSQIFGIILDKCKKLLFDTNLDCEYNTFGILSSIDLVVSKRNIDLTPTSGSNHLPHIMINDPVNWFLTMLPLIVDVVRQICTYNLFTTGYQDTVKGGEHENLSQPYLLPYYSASYINAANDKPH
jgi:hypothetical protein